MSAVIYGICFIAFTVLGIVQIYAGYLGIQLHWGPIWAAGFVVGMFMFRFTLPLTIGSYFCATELWGWHWVWALLFAMPGLLFMVPAFMAGLLDRGKAIRRS